MAIANTVNKMFIIEFWIILRQFLCLSIIEYKNVSKSSSTQKTY